MSAIRHGCGFKSRARNPLNLEFSWSAAQVNRGAQIKLQVVARLRASAVTATGQPEASRGLNT